MSNKYFISAFGTFGNPNGFRQSYWFTNDRSIVNNTKTFDLNTNAIKLFPKSTVYAVRKEVSGRNNTIAYSIYSYAKEQNSDRSGTFIGSSILFIDKVSEENITINCLNEFHNNLKNKNVENDTITVNHSDNFSVNKPKDFDKINFHLREIENLNFTQTTNRQLVVYCETNPSKLQPLFKKAIDLLNVYDTIYFTESSEVAEFVHQKNIFQLVQKDGFENEIQKLAEERLRKIEATKEELENAIQKVIDDQKLFSKEFNSDLKKLESIHQENEQKIKKYKGELPVLESYYSDFIKKINEVISQLKTDGKSEVAKKKFNEYNRIFIDSINRQQKSNFLNSISKPNTRTDLRTAPQPLQTGYFYNDNDNEKHHRRKNNRIDIFKIATLILLFLWIGTIIYFNFVNRPEKETIHINKPQQEQTTIEKDTINIKPNK